MGHEIKPIPPAPCVVDGAAIGCCFAQSGSMMEYKEMWDKRYLRILHNDSEKQCGLEMAHNYDCVPVENVPKFNICKSPYYYETVGILKSLYPDNKDYAKGFESYCRINAKAEGGSPPCIGAFLDTWFNSSDIVIADKYQEFINKTLFFTSRMREKIEEMRKWSESEIKRYRKRAEREYGECISDLGFERRMRKLVSNLEKISEKDDREKNSPNAIERIAEEVKEYRDISDKMFCKYDIVERKVKKLYEEGKRKVERWDGYIDAIQVYDGDYCKTLEKLANEIEGYRNKWSDALSDAEINMDSWEASGFFYYCDKMVSDARKLAADGADDKRIGKALLTSSFLICKCGGKIEFLNSGQERVLYCENLFKKFEELLKDAVTYLGEVLMQNGVYAGVQEEESNESVEDAIWALQEVINGIEEERSFNLGKDMPAVRIRFISRSRKDEEETLRDEFVAILFFGLISEFGTAANILVSATTMIMDAVDISKQSKGEQEYNKVEDAVVFGADMTGYFNSIIEGAVNTRQFKSLAGDKPAKICEVTDTGLTAIGHIMSIGSLFYTSEENWIEEIEITVFTKYMAHIIKQSYNEDLTPQKPFYGPSMVRGKAKKDYLCDTMGNVDWDNMEGVTFGIKEHFGEAIEEDNVDGMYRIENKTKVYKK